MASSTDICRTLQRDRRAKTQPQPKPNDQTLPKTLNMRRATYHTNDGTQHTMEEGGSNLLVCSSKDSGLSSAMSSTPSVADNLSSNVSNIKGEKDSSLTLSERNTADDLEEHTISVSNGSMEEAVMTDNNEKKLSIDRTDSTDSGVFQDPSGKLTDLHTIHELEYEVNETASDDIDIQKRNIQTEDNVSASFSNKTTHRGLRGLLNALFGRCFRSRKPSTSTRALELGNDLRQSTHHPPQGKGKASPRKSPLHRPESGYDSLKVQSPPADIATPTMFSDTNNLQIESAEVAAVLGIVQALQRFQNGQRMSPESLAGKSVQTVNFAAKFLTEKGGRINLPMRHVNLYIPPGAIPPGAVQLVYVYVLAPDESSSLNDDETWLTPSVHCGPSGLHFNKNVFLTMPHCAADAQQWEFTTHQVKKKNGGAWRRLEDNKEVMVVKQKEKLTMLMTHFCGHKVSGTSEARNDDVATKKMNVAVYLDRNADDDGKIKIDVCISNRGEEVLSLERRIRRNFPTSYLNPSTESLQFISDDRFGDLCFALDFLESSLSRGWTAVANKLGDISPDLVHCAKRQMHRSPSAIILDSFFQMQVDERKEVMETLEFLSHVFAEIDSHDAKRIVDEEIKERAVTVRKQLSTAAGSQFQQQSGQETMPETQELHVRGCANNVVVKVAKISAGWRINTKQQEIDFDDVWSLCHKTDSSAVTFDIIADKDVVTTPDEFEATIHVFQENHLSQGVTFDVGKPDIQEMTGGEDQQYNKPAESELIQVSVCDIQDKRLRQPFISVESEQAWRDLFKLTNVCDPNVLKSLNEHTHCPPASALDLFFAVHDTNQEALNALQQYERQSSDNSKNPGKAEATNSSTEIVVPTGISFKSAVFSKVTWVKDKGKALLRRKGPQNRHKMSEGDSGVILGEKEAVRRFEKTNTSIPFQEELGITNKSFQESGIDNPAFYSHDLVPAKVTPAEPSISENVIPSSRTPQSEEQNLDETYHQQILQGAVNGEVTSATRKGHDCVDVLPVDGKMSSNSTRQQAQVISSDSEDGGNNVTIGQIMVGECDYVKISPIGERNRPKRNDSALSHESGFGTYDRNSNSTSSSVFSNNVFDNCDILSNHQPERTNSTLSQDSGIGTCDRNMTLMLKINE